MLTNLSFGFKQRLGGTTGDRWVNAGEANI
jgi:hypothetical protein